MANVFPFIREGWRNIWKQNAIWLFSALPMLGQPMSLIPINPYSSALLSLIYLAQGGLAAILTFVSSVGVPYLAYSLSTGKSVSMQETLAAVKKFAGRILGFDLVILLLLSPFLCWALVVSINAATRTVQLSGTTLLVFLPFSLFSAMSAFTLFGFFADDLGIRESAQKAWALFSANFATLTILGLLLALAIKIYLAASGVLAVLIQSSFDFAALSKLDFLNPSASLRTNIPFVLISGIFETIFSPFSYSVFVLVYLKSSGARVKRK